MTDLRPRLPASDRGPQVRKARGPDAMLSRHFDCSRSSILAVSLCAAIALPAAAQETSPGLSSGSGQGTGSGRFNGSPAQPDRFDVGRRPFGFQSRS